MEKRSKCEDSEKTHKGRFDFIRRSIELKKCRALNLLQQGRDGLPQRRLLPLQGPLEPLQDVVLGLDLLLNLKNQNDSGVGIAQ